MTRRGIWTIDFRDNEGRHRTVDLVMTANPEDPNLTTIAAHRLGALGYRVSKVLEAKVKK